jgi:acyl-coenzyme A thioesterase PaaI-like protein
MSTTQTDPRLFGYQKWEGFDPFEEQSGPFYFKQEDDGSYRCAFISEAKHMNGQGNMHGGTLMTFADYAMFVVARPAIDSVPTVTVSFNSEFTAAAGIGEFIEATGEIVQETGSMVFVRGKIFSGHRPLLNFSGVLKKLRSRDTQE